MRGIVAAVCLAIVLACTAAQQGQRAAVPPAIQKLRDPLIQLPLKALFSNMQNRNTVTFYVNCVLGEGRCDHVGSALRHLIVDLVPNQEMCYGCSSCEREKVTYVLDVMKNKYPDLACKAQNALKRPIFDGSNPCI